MTLSETLKNDSREAHDHVDHAVMAMKPFDSHAHYQKFLQIQRAFHAAVKPAYHGEWAQKLGGIESLDRGDKIMQDLADLGASAQEFTIDYPVPQGARAIGWLYCAEGSNVGAAILYKHAGKIELDDEFGARHLAAHPDGRMPHWRAFKEKLDALVLTDAQKQEAVEGARDAFIYYQKLIQAVA